MPRFAYFSAALVTFATGAAQTVRTMVRVYGRKK